MRENSISSPLGAPYSLWISRNFVGFTPNPYRRCHPVDTTASNLVWASVGRRQVCWPKASKQALWKASAACCGL